MATTIVSDGEGPEEGEIQDSDDDVIIEEVRLPPKNKVRGNVYSRDRARPLPSPQKMFRQPVRVAPKRSKSPERRHSKVRGRLHSTYSSSRERLRKRKMLHSPAKSRRILSPVRRKSRPVKNSVPVAVAVTEKTTNIAKQDTHDDDEDDELTLRLAALKSSLAKEGISVDDLLSENIPATFLSDPKVNLISTKEPVTKLSASKKVSLDKRVESLVQSGLFSDVDLDDRILISGPPMPTDIQEELGISEDLGPDGPQIPEDMDISSSDETDDQMEGTGESIIPPSAYETTECEYLESMQLWESNYPAASYVLPDNVQYSDENWPYSVPTNEHMHDVVMSANTKVTDEKRHASQRQLVYVPIVSGEETAVLPVESPEETASSVSRVQDMTTAVDETEELSPENLDLNSVIVLDQVGFDSSPVTSPLKSEKENVIKESLPGEQNADSCVNGLPKKEEEELCDEEDEAILRAQLLVDMAKKHESSPLKTIGPANGAMELVPANVEQEPLPTEVKLKKTVGEKAVARRPTSTSRVFLSDQYQTKKPSVKYTQNGVGNVSLQSLKITIPNSPLKSTKAPPVIVPKTSRIVINLDEDSNDSDDETQDEMQNDKIHRSVLDSAIDDLLKKSRAASEKNNVLKEIPGKTANKVLKETPGRTANNVLKETPGKTVNIKRIYEVGTTPQSLHHLPKDKQEEYRRLKAELVRRTKIAGKQIGVAKSVLSPKKQNGLGLATKLVTVSKKDKGIRIATTSTKLLTGRHSLTTARVPLNPSTSLKVLQERKLAQLTAQQNILTQKMQKLGKTTTDNKKKTLHQVLRKGTIASGQTAASVKCTSVPPVKNSKPVVSSIRLTVTKSDNKISSKVNQDITTGRVLTSLPQSSSGSSCAAKLPVPVQHDKDKDLAKPLFVIDTEPQLLQPEEIAGINQVLETSEILSKNMSEKKSNANQHLGIENIIPEDDNFTKARNNLKKLARHSIFKEITAAGPQVIETEEKSVDKQKEDEDKRSRHDSSENLDVLRSEVLLSLYKNGPKKESGKSMPLESEQEVNKEESNMKSEVMKLETKDFCSESQSSVPIVTISDSSDSDTDTVPLKTDLCIGEKNNDASHDIAKMQKNAELLTKNILLERNPTVTEDGLEGISNETAQLPNSELVSSSETCKLPEENSVKELDEVSKKGLTNNGNINLSNFIQPKKSKGGTVKTKGISKLVVKKYGKGKLHKHLQLTNMEKQVISKRQTVFGILNDISSTLVILKEKKSALKDAENHLSLLRAQLATAENDAQNRRREVSQMINTVKEMHSNMQLSRNEHSSLEKACLQFGKLVKGSSYTLPNGGATSVKRKLEQVVISAKKLRSSTEETHHSPVNQTDTMPPEMKPSSDIANEEPKSSSSKSSPPMQQSAKMESDKSSDSVPRVIAGQKVSKFDTYKSPLDYLAQRSDVMYETSLNPQVALCHFDLRGKCNDESCPLQHDCRKKSN